MIQGVKGTLPPFARAMFEKGTESTASYWKPIDTALDAPWIQLHRTNRHFLMLDFDDQGWDAWRNLPLPPNFVCHNPKSGNHQAFFWLETPVHCHESAKTSKAYRYLSILEKVIDQKYGGDEGFTRGISKNPFSPTWDVSWIHDHKFSLKELENGLIGERTKVLYGNKNTIVKCDKTGRTLRHSSLFESVRFKAYRQVKKYKEIDNIEYSDWYRVVLGWVNDANVFEYAEPLPLSSVRNTAKSISKWVWYVYNYNDKKQRDRRVMSDEELKSRQSLAAKMTNESAKAATEAKIKVAINHLIEQGKKPSKAAVARIVKISRVQVSTKYSHLFPS